VSSMITTTEGDDEHRLLHGVPTKVRSAVPDVKPTDPGSHIVGAAPVR
jgi:hypothetical protein